MADQTEFDRLLSMLGQQALILPYAGAPFGLSLNGAVGQWEVCAASGEHHSFLPATMSLAAALDAVRLLCATPGPTETSVPEQSAEAQVSEAGAQTEALAAPDLEIVGRVCWTHPLYDGQAETWRPRTRVETAYPTIAAFLAAKQAEGWESETFPEVMTTAAGEHYPVIAVSLTRTRFGGAPQDDLIHVWVERVAPAQAAGDPGG